MNTSTTFASVAILICAAASATTLAKEISLPPEQIQWRQSSLPGYEKVQQSCMICHSAHYAEYQPRTSTRNYWEAQVKRMKTVFNAPVQDADIADITDYLYATYSRPGMEESKKPADAKR